MLYPWMIQCSVIERSYEDDSKRLLFARVKSSYDNLSMLTGCFLICPDVFANRILIKLVLITIDQP